MQKPWRRGRRNGCFPWPSGTEGAFALALAGGETPRPLYEQFAAPPFRDEFPWARAHIFWGDERFVAHDDPRSNFRSARETFLARVPIPVQNIHPVDTRAEDAEAAAQAYQRELLAFHGVALLTAARPLFDVTLLGLGEDGHMASLFPGDAALCERQSWTAATRDPTGLARITLTYPAIESSRRVAFLITGAEKERGSRAPPQRRPHAAGGASASGRRTFPVRRRGRRAGAGLIRSDRSFRLRAAPHRSPG